MNIDTISLTQHDLLPFFGQFKSRNSGVHERMKDDIITSSTAVLKKVNKIQI